MAFSIRSSALVSILGLLVAGCGDRIQVSHRINVNQEVMTERAVPVIEAALDPALLERLGGRLPEVWPQEVPPVSISAPIDLAIAIAPPDLGGVGQDLSRVSDADFELRLRGIDWTLDGGGASHSFHDVEVWVGTVTTFRAEEPGTRFVGYAPDIEHGFGEIVFAPGGRRAFADYLLEEEFHILLRLSLLFDTQSNPERPEGAVSVNLVVHLDILR